jgi:hypothetical protein
MTGACGPESWSFDHDASLEEAGSIPPEDASGGDDRPDSPVDAAFDSGFIIEAGPDAETGPAAEADAPCSEDDDCPSDAPLCSLPARMCIRCTVDLDCARDGGALVCNISTGACVQCTSNSDCSARSLPYCYTVTDRCVQCLDSAECGSQSNCQLATHTCTRMF